MRTARAIGFDQRVVIVAAAQPQFAEHPHRRDLLGEPPAMPIDHRESRGVQWIPVERADARGPVGSVDAARCLTAANLSSREKHAAGQNHAGKASRVHHRPDRTHPDRLSRLS